MTAISVNQGGRISTVGTKLTTTSETAVYAPDDGMQPIVLAINVANVNGTTACDVSLSLYDASAGETYAIVSTKSVAADSREAVTDFPIAMEDGDEIRATAGTANDLHVLVTVMESSGRYRAPGA